MAKKRKKKTLKRKSPFKDIEKKIERMNVLMELIRRDTNEMVSDIYHIKLKVESWDVEHCREEIAKVQKKQLRLFEDLQARIFLRLSCTTKDILAIMDKQLTLAEIATIPETAKVDPWDSSLK